MNPPEPIPPSTATELAQPELHLYYSPNCGYCHHVLRSLEPLELNVTLHDIDADTHARARLLAATGRERVPVLHILETAPDEDVGDTQLATSAGQWMPESLDITRKLKQLAGVATAPVWLDTLTKVSQPVGIGLMLGALLTEGAMSTSLGVTGALVFALGLLRRVFF